MTEVSCPVCDNPVIIGLPHDASVEHVKSGGEPDTGDAGLTKTRVVRCPQEHGVAVTFSIESPE